MPTRILFDPRVDLPDGSSTSSPVVVEATQTGIRASGAVVTFPTTLSFSIASAADVIQLAAPPAGHAWKLTVRRQASTRYGGFVTPTGGATLESRLVTWTDAPTVAWADLTDVDPATLAPAAAPAAWDAQLAALQAQVAGIGVGNDPAFQYAQTVPSAQWTISHTFGRRPDVNVYLTTGERVITDVTASTTQVVITFPTPTAGYAVLT